MLTPTPCPIRREWDADGDGVPDNYVLATQPQNLINGLDRAFDFIDSRLSSASSASVNSGSISDQTRIYQTRFNSGTWTGQLLAFRINADGTLGNGVPPLLDSEADMGRGRAAAGLGFAANHHARLHRRQGRLPLGLARRHAPVADR